MIHHSLLSVFTFFIIESLRSLRYFYLFTFSRAITWNFFSKNTWTQCCLHFFPKTLHLIKKKNATRSTLWTSSLLDSLKLHCYFSGDSVTSLLFCHSGNVSEASNGGMRCAVAGKLLSAAYTFQSNKVRWTAPLDVKK